jgi:hypothetical protein
MSRSTRRFISIPRPVDLLDPMTDDLATDPDTKKPLPSVAFFDFARRALLVDPRFHEDYHGVCARSDIAAAMRAPVDGVIELAEDDWQMLKAVVEKPEHVAPTPMGPQRAKGYGYYHPLVIVQFKGFLDAIVSAGTSPPLGEKR